MSSTSIDPSPQQEAVFDRLRQTFARSYVGHVALVASNSFFEQKVRRVLPGDNAPQIVQWPVSGAEPGSSGVAVAFLGPDLPSESAIAMAQAIDREHPDVYIVIVANPTAELFEQALRVGARDVVAPNVGEAKLAEVMERAVETASRRRQQASTAKEAGGSRHRVISVLSPKGGVGKTFISTNLAVGLGQFTPNDVALVDLDLQFGDIAASLHLMPEHTFADATRSTMAREASMVKIVMAAHESGVYTMCAPDDPAQADDITYDQSAEIIKQLSRSFSTVIIDTPAGLDPHSLAATEISTDLLFVCSVDVASVRALRKELEALDRLGMTYQSRSLVINRSNAPGGARPEDVETAIGLKAVLSLPADPAVLAAANQGNPIVRADPKSLISKRVMAYCETFIGRDEQSAPTAKSGLSLPWRRGK